MAEQAAYGQGHFRRVHRYADTGTAGLRDMDFVSLEASHKRNSRHLFCRPQSGLHHDTATFAERFGAFFYETETGGHYLDAGGITTLPIVYDALSQMME